MNNETKLKDGVAIKWWWSKAINLECDFKHAFNPLTTVEIAKLDFFLKKMSNFEAKYLGTGKSKTCQVCAHLKAHFKIYLSSVPEFWLRSFKKTTAAEKIVLKRPKFGLAVVKELNIPNQTIKTVFLPN